MEVGKYNLIETLFSDLDGTLIFSAKRKQVGDIIIERKNGEPISCITARQAELFAQLENVIPVTTRSIEQYRRIEFAKFGFEPEYALCVNGGTLLVNGEPDGEWSRWSRSIFEDCADELSRFRELLERDIRRTFEVRLVDGLFLFTKSSDSSETLKYLGEGKTCECYFTGEKVYVIPRKLNKGAAVKRLAERLGLSEFAAAGDSLMDISMLNAAQTAVFTEDIPKDMITAPDKLSFPREGFGEALMEQTALILGNSQ